MGVKEFDLHFGMKISLEEEQRKFVNRIENTLFVKARDLAGYWGYEALFKSVCYQLGEDADDLIGNSFASSFGGETAPSLGILTKKDFIQSLRVTVAVYDFVKSDPPSLEIIDNMITSA